MAIKVIPNGSRKGGGGMDIGKTPKKKSPPTLIQNLANAMAKLADPQGRIASQDISRAKNILKGMMKKAGGGKVKKKK